MGARLRVFNSSLLDKVQQLLLLLRICLNSLGTSNETNRWHVFTKRRRTSNNRFRGKHGTNFKK